MATLFTPGKRPTRIRFIKTPQSTYVTPLWVDPITASKLGTLTHPGRKPGRAFFVLSRGSTALVSGQALVLNLSDTGTSSDSRAMTVVLAKSDAVTASDSLSKADILNRGDSVAATDSTPPKTIVLNKADSVAATETVLLTEGNFTDLIIGPTQIFTLHINDLISSSDLPTKTNIFLRSISDTATVTESSVKSPILNKSDVVTATDVPTKILTHFLSDTASSADSRASGVVLNKSDSVSAGDAMTTASNFIRQLSDSTAPSDSRNSSIVVLKQDGMTALDLPAKSIVVAKADSVTASDIINTLHGLSKNLSDSIGATDARASAAIKILNDSITTIDDRISTSIYQRTISDSIIVLEEKRTASNTLRTIADAILATDAPSKASTLNKADSVSVSDLKALSFIKTLLDSIFLNDNIPSNQYISRQVFEQDVTETVLSSAIAIIAVRASVVIEQVGPSSSTLANKSMITINVRGSNATIKQR